MKRTDLSIFGATVLVCVTSISAMSQVEGPVHVPPGTTVRAALEKWLDARKNKVGDEVIAKVTEHVKTDGRVVIPKGSRLVGHLTDVKVRTKDEPRSMVGIRFDHAVLKGGSEIPLALTIQAIAPGETAAAPVLSMTPATAGGMTGGTPPVNMGPMSDPNAGTPGRVASPDDSVYDSPDHLSSTGKLTPSCRGILGIDGLTLSSDPTDSTQRSLIVSLRQNVRLDGNTQLMLRVIGK